MYFLLQMGGASHPKGSMAASFSMVHTSHMSQKRMEQNLTQHHQGASGGAMEQLHMPGGMVMTPGNMHAFGGGAGVGNLATSSAPGKGLGGALMQAPAQQVIIMRFEFLVEQQLFLLFQIGHFCFSDFRLSPASLTLLSLQ